MAELARAHRLDVEPLANPLHTFGCSTCPPAMRVSLLGLMRRAKRTRKRALGRLTPLSHQWLWLKHGWHRLGRHWRPRGQ
jgi:hypothetical protein